jgi:hypothetical protein
VLGREQVEVERRRRAIARRRERLALAMTRLSQAHWELDRLVEAWIDQESGSNRAESAGSVLGTAVEEYGRAFSDVVAMLSDEDCGRS